MFVDPNTNRVYSNALAAVQSQRPATLTAEGRRHLLSELAQMLSDEQITKMLSGLPVDVYIEADEGPWAVIPVQLARKRWDTEVSLEWEDVNPVDLSGGF
jgi:hypothetical protein